VPVRSALDRSRPYKAFRPALAVSSWRTAAANNAQRCSTQRCGRDPYERGGDDALLGGHDRPKLASGGDARNTGCKGTELQDAPLDPIRDGTCLGDQSVERALRRHKLAGE
jgi:hypothetical protein